jgi:hypothetical protein
MHHVVGNVGAPTAWAVVRPTLRQEQFAVHQTVEVLDRKAERIRKLYFEQKSKRK